MGVPVTEVSTDLLYEVYHSYWSLRGPIEI